jgi:hypothetical protein
LHGWFFVSVLLSSEESIWVRQFCDAYTLRHGRTVSAIKVCIDLFEVRIHFIGDDENDLDVINNRFSVG